MSTFSRVCRGFSPGEIVYHCYTASNGAKKYHAFSGRFFQLTFHVFAEGLLSEKLSVIIIPLLFMVYRSLK